MAIYFVYRYEGVKPNGKFTKRIESDSLLSFFQEIWRTDLPYDELYEWYKEKFGYDFERLDLFCELITAYDEELITSASFKRRMGFNLKFPYPPPASSREIGAYVHIFFAAREVNYYEKEGFLHNSESGYSWYLFEERLLQNYPEIFSFLARKDWKLPLDFQQDGSFIPSYKFSKYRETLDTHYSSDGSVYFIEFANCSCEAHPIELKGIRLPQLIPYLVETRNREKELPWSLRLWGLLFTLYPLRENVIDNFRLPEIECIQLIDSYWGIVKTDEDKLLSNNLIIAKTELEEALQSVKEYQVKESHRNPQLNLDEFLVHGNDHLIQLSIHPYYDCYDHLIVFDDLWASTNPNLANSLLNYAKNWEVFTK